MEADLISFAGHSNPFDVSLGKLTSCTRGGSDPEGLGRLPGWSDDYCHAMPATRTWRRDEPFIDAAALSAVLTILSGCHGFVPGRGQHDPDMRIVAGLQRSEGLATAAPVGLRPRLSASAWRKSRSGCPASDSEA